MNPFRQESLLPHDQNIAFGFGSSLSVSMRVPFLLPDIGVGEDRGDVEQVPVEVRQTEVADEETLPWDDVCWDGEI